MRDDRGRFRMDFRLRVVKADEETRMVWFVLEPDPRRYEWREEKGRRILYDKLDHIAIPEDVLADAIRQTSGTGIYAQEQQIGDAEHYVRSRRAHIQAMLDGSELEPVFEDKSEEFLRSLNQDELGFAVVCVDIVGST
ncbi:MAG: hypothetical protein MUQ65_04310, partial [Armatimonadetes bacterium]|nr:hypothetical protein [Armatimonadota bacterium]